MAADEVPSARARARAPEMSAASVWAWLRWTWWWLVTELVMIVVLVVVAVIPAARASHAVAWPAAGLAVLVFAGGLWLGWGRYLYLPPSLAGGDDQSRAWLRLPQTRRRELTVLLRRGRGEQVPLEERPVAAGQAARVLARGLTLNTGQVSLGVLWAALSVLRRAGDDELRWFGVAIAVAFGAIGVVTLCFARGFLRSLTQLDGRGVSTTT